MCPDGSLALACMHARSHVTCALSLQALLKMTVEFRKEQTRFLNKKEAQKGMKVGGTLGLVENDSQVCACCVCVCVWGGGGFSSATATKAILAAAHCCFIIFSTFSSSDCFCSLLPPPYRLPCCCLLLLLLPLLPLCLLQMALSETDPGFTAQQLAMVDISNALAEERDKEIRKIVETITELAQVCGVVWCGVVWCGVVWCVGGGWCGV